MNKDFVLTRVVTKDFLRDSFAKIRNMFGMRLRSYEQMINKNTVELLEEMRLTYNVKWYRVSINPLVNGSAMITVYGECE